MSRQAQNLLMGALACVVAAVAMVAVAIMLKADDGSIDASVDPLSGGVSDVANVEAGKPSANDLTDSPSAAPSTPPLTVAVTTSSTSSTTSTSAPTTTSMAITTSSTIASSTTTTAAPTSSETAGDGGSTETTVGMTTTTADPASTRPNETKPPGTTDQTTTTTIIITTEAPPTTVVDGGSLNEYEREIARLTNELRTNPNGPLKRRGPVINCGGRIRADLSSGQYEPIGALSVHQAASLQVARPWSAQMSRSNFSHRPNAGVGALQNIGIAVRSAGENIAYHNYPDKALNHFTGWRESDGHFCNMMDPGFTHIGVGEVTKSDGISYATQNFFSLR